MLRKLVILGVVAAIAGMVIGGATLASADDNGNGGATVLTLRSMTIQDTEIDLGRKGFSQGDRVTFRDRLMTLDGERVGTAHGDCVFTEVARDLVRARCGITAVFGQHSTLDFAGVLTFTSEQQGSRFFLSVTGGTGRYIGAEGEARGMELTAGTVELRIRLID
jgi:hypothetical protein